jgi:hypothetical protein
MEEILTQKHVQDLVLRGPRQLAPEVKKRSLFNVQCSIVILGCACGAAPMAVER